MVWCCASEIFTYDIVWVHHLQGLVERSGALLIGPKVKVGALAC